MKLPAMNKIIYLSSLWIFILIFSGQALADSGTISIRAGEVRVLNIEGITRVAIGDPGKISYKTLDSNQIMIIGKEKGGSSLHVWRNGGREIKYWVNIENRFYSDDIKIASMLTKDIPDINIYELDSKVIIEGAITDDDMTVMDAVRSMLPNAVFILTKKKISNRPLIRTDVVLLEIGTNDMRKLGLDWDDSISGPVYAFHKTFTEDRFRVANPKDQSILGAVPVGDNSFFSYSGITSQIASTINILESDGLARVLSAPKLTALSGESAKFHVGGSFPIPVINAVGAASVDRQNYGVQLDVTPVADKDIINLKVRVDLSDIDPSVTVNGVPGTSNRTTETQVQLKHNQTVAIAGLFSTADSNGNSGVPGLKNIPVLKYFFGVDESNIEDRQVVVLLTPKVITPGNADDRALSDFGRGMIKEYRSKLTIDSALME